MPLTLESLFRTYADDVCRIVARLLGPGASEADVDDLAQQVFLAAHRALPRFRGDSQVRTWMYGITARIVLQHLRGRRRYRAMIERFEAAMELVETPPGLEEEIARRQALHRVWSALLRIKPERRVVFVLFEIEGLSAGEIAAVLGVKEEAVRSRLRRAREDLAARMKEARR
jgi:RNA polymerase sigma-70 factor (ECF subfamily)